MRRPLRVAYLVRYLPAPTETFVLDEATSLQEVGVWVRPWVLDRKPEAVRHSRHESLYAAARVVPRPSSVRCLAASLGVEAKPSYRQVSQNWSRFGRYQDLRRVAWLVQAWRRARIDVVRVHHAAETARHAVAAAILAGIPVSVAVHARDLFVPVGDLSWILTGASHVSTITPFHRDRLLRLGLPSQHVAILSCSVEIPSSIAPSPREGEPLKVISVGRLIAKKGHDLTLEACGAIARDGTKVELLIVGEGPERPMLEEFAQTLEGQAEGRLKVMIPGMKEAEWIDGQHASGSFHAAVLACRVDRNGDRDGVPVALMEAQAHGIPVVTSALPGFEYEFSTEGGASLLPLYDRDGSREPSAGDLVASLSAIYRDSGYRNALSVAARETAESRLNRQEVGHRLYGMLAPLCSNIPPLRVG